MENVISYKLEDFEGPLDLRLNPQKGESAAQRLMSVSEEELIAEANKWEMSHGGVSGRTAQQFINYVLGKVKN